MGNWSTRKLVLALDEANAPADLVAAARADAFHDFRSSSPHPIIDLVRACERAGLHDIAEHAKNGEFDATAEEAEEWARSPEGQAAFRLLTEKQK